MPRETCGFSEVQDLPARTGSAMISGNTTSLPDNGRGWAVLVRAPLTGITEHKAYILRVMRLDLAGVLRRGSIRQVGFGSLAGWDAPRVQEHAPSPIF